MPTLHIKHAISDLDTWLSAFKRFAEVRRQAGVRGERVQRPIGDARYIVVDLDFDTLEEADSFRRFLETQVWAVPENAPALDGTPDTMILQPVAT